VAALSFVPTPEGGWAFNAGTAPGTPPPVFHAVWTDNRDVRPPVAPQTWESYTPPTFSQADWPANPLRPACVPGTTGMRNANVYTSRITPGLSLSTPGNALA
jgi:hypothetical protein